MARTLTVGVTIAAVGGTAWYVVMSSAPDAVELHELPPLRFEACGYQCGVQRWAVKTLSDETRTQIDLRPVSATVAQLASLARPSSLPNYYRVPPAETTIYQVRAYLVGWSPQDDGDIHLVLADLEYQRVLLIAEIPDPSCAGVCNSGFGEYFAAAREELNRILSEPNPLDQAILVEVTGVGFFDRNHGQVGAAPNYFELHPVLHLVQVQP